MSLPLSVIALGGGLVGLRMVRGPVLKAALRRLSTGEAAKLVLPRAEFEMPGKVEQLAIREPTLASAFTAAPLLVRLDAPGKLPVMELTTGFRRVRRLLTLRAKGPNLSIVAIPSPSDIVNFLTLAILVCALGAAAKAGWVYWAGIGALLAADGWLRLRVGEGSIRRALGRLGAK